MGQLETNYDATVEQSALHRGRFSFHVPSSDCANITGNSALVKTVDTLTTAAQLQRTETNTSDIGTILFDLFKCQAYILRRVQIVIAAYAAAVFSGGAHGGAPSARNRRLAPES